MNFIIYEDEDKFTKRYENVILKIMVQTNLNYKIIRYTEYNDNMYDELSILDGKKIYILDIEVPGKNGIELAREIRKNGDWESPIIIVTSHNEFQSVGYTGKILMLDFIDKSSNIERNLNEALSIAFDIINEKKTICFVIRGEMYQIPYQDIFYIEKNLNDNSCFIVTNDNEYEIRETIQNLEAQLSTERNFIKTHRSFVVNTKNITHVDLEQGKITFPNKKFALVSRSNKKKLKERMGINVWLAIWLSL